MWKDVIFDPFEEPLEIDTSSRDFPSVNDSLPEWMPQLEFDYQIEIIPVKQEIPEIPSQTELLKSTVDIATEIIDTKGPLLELFPFPTTNVLDTMDSDDTSLSNFDDLTAGPPRPINDKIKEEPYIGFESDVVVAESQQPSKKRVSPWGHPNLSFTSPVIVFDSPPAKRACRCFAAQN